MYKRQKSKDDEMDKSNYCLFTHDSPKEENKNLEQINFNKLSNPKTTIPSKKKNINLKLNEIQDIDINNNNKDNNEDTFRNFKLLDDTLKGEKKINFDDNINNIDNNQNKNININNNENNKINLPQNINLNFNDDEDENNQNNKNIVNNIININNNFNNNIVNINY